MKHIDNNIIDYYIPQNMILKENDQSIGRPHNNYLFYDIILNNGRVSFFSRQYPDFKIDFNKIKIKTLNDNKFLNIEYMTASDPNRGGQWKQDKWGLVIGDINLHSKVKNLDIEVLYKDKKKKFHLYDYSEDFNSEIILSTFFWHDVSNVKMWIDYHKNLGVDQFHLYFNDKVDKYLESSPRFNGIKWDRGLNTLKEYIDSGIVKLFEWDYAYGYHPNEKNLTEEAKQYAKVPDSKWYMLQDDLIINNSLYRLKNNCKWVNFFFLDQFIVLPDRCKNIREYLFDDDFKYEVMGDSWITVYACDSVIENLKFPTIIDNKGVDDLHNNKIYITKEFFTENLNMTGMYCDKHNCAKPDRMNMINVHFPVAKHCDRHTDGWIRDNWPSGYEKNSSQEFRYKKMREMYLLHMIEFSGKGFSKARPENLRSIQYGHLDTVPRRLTKDGHLENWDG